MFESRDEWEFFLSNWKEQYGQEINGRSGSYMGVPVNSNLRREMYRVLANTLVEKGMTVQDLISSSTKNRIIEASVNVASEKGRQLSIWKDMCAKDWLAVVASEFPDTFVSKTTKNIRKSDQTEVTYEPSTENETSQEFQGETIELQNPWDDKIQTGIAKPKFVVDQEFLDMLRGNDE